MLIGPFVLPGAQNDLERITQMAYQQVAVYGMNENIGLVSFPPRDDQFNKPYSNETAQTIDKEVRTIIDTAYKRCLDLLTEKKDLVEKLALTLLDKEVDFPVFACPFERPPLQILIQIVQRHKMLAT